MRTIFPEETFLSTNPDYDYPHNTAGNFTPPYTGEYYMRAVGGGGSGSLKTNYNECIGGGAGGGYEGRIFLVAGDIIPYSVGTGGAAPTLGQNGNNGTDTIFGNIVLGGGFGATFTPFLGKGGSAGQCKAGSMYLSGATTATEFPQSSGNLFSGGSGMVQYNNDSTSYFDYLINACGKHVRPRAQVITYNDAPYYIRFGGCSVFGLPGTYVAVYGGTAYGTGGTVNRGANQASAGAGGRIQIWRL